MTIPKAAQKKRRRHNANNKRTNSANSNDQTTEEDQANAGQSGASFLEGSIKEDGSYQLGGRRSGVSSCWSDLTTEEKIDVLTLDEEHVMDNLRRITKDRFAITGETVKLFQALFLRAMERDKGVLQLGDVPFDAAAVLIALEEQFLFAYLERDLSRKVALILFFFVWSSHYYWIGLPVSAFIYFSEACTPLKNQFCSFVKSFFINHSDPIQVEWKSHCYLTTLLLFNLAQGATQLSIISIFSLIPYLISGIRNNASLSKNSADHNSLKLVMEVMSLLNKVILLYFAWGAYSSLILVAVLFFSDLALSILSFGFLCTAVVVTYFPVLLCKIVPNSIQHSFLNWKGRGNNAMFVSLAPFPISALIIYWTWEWNSPWGGLFRWITVFFLIQVLPTKLMNNSGEFIKSALMILLKAFHFVGIIFSNLYSKFFGQGV